MLPLIRYVVRKIHFSISGAPQCGCNKGPLKSAGFGSKFGGEYNPGYDGAAVKNVSSVFSGQIGEFGVSSLKATMQN